jgi:hypothetical protein
VSANLTEHLLLHDEDTANAFKSSESLSTWNVKLASHVKTTSKRSSYLTRGRDLLMSVPPREYISELDAFRKRSIDWFWNAIVPMNVVLI